MSNTDEFFTQLQSHIDPAKTTGMNATYQFVVTGEDAGTWHVAIRDGQPSVEKGQASDPDITLTATKDDWVDILSGKLNGQTAFLSGKLQIQGDIGLALKLQSILS